MYNLYYIIMLIIYNFCYIYSNCVQLLLYYANYVQRLLY